jgi:hypothetical protein
VALGIAAGALIRRTLPALAVTIVVFTFLRLVIGQDFRSHYLTAVTRFYSFLHPAPMPTGSFWQISQGLIGRGGQVLSTQPNVSGLHIDGVPLQSMPLACQAVAFQITKVFPCLTARGLRGFVTYQPASRYWAFQGIETGIYVVLAAALLAVTAIVVLRRDA